MAARHEKRSRSNVLPKSRKRCRLRPGRNAAKLARHLANAMPALPALSGSNGISAPSTAVLATSGAVTSLAGDVARSNDRARSAYTHQVNVYLDLIATLIDGESAKARRVKAIAVWTSLVGALSMARAVNDEKVSREILKTAAEQIKAQLG